MNSIFIDIFELYPSYLFLKLVCSINCVRKGFFSTNYQFYYKCQLHDLNRIVMHFHQFPSTETVELSKRTADVHRLCLLLLTNSENKQVHDVLLYYAT